MISSPLPGPQTRLSSDGAASRRSHQPHAQAAGGGFEEAESDALLNGGASSDAGAAEGRLGVAGGRESVSGSSASSSNSLGPKAALLVVLVSLVVLCSMFLTRDRVQLLMSWVLARPLEGGILLVFLYTIGLVVMFPSIILSLAGGAIFGVYLGSFLAWLGTTLGQTLAFVAGRYLLRDMVLTYVMKRYPKWLVIDQAISKEGWKLVTLLRLSPLIPWSLLNYALSITGISFTSYTIASSISIIPWSIVFVYFGSLVTTLADVFDGNAGPDPAYRTAFLVGSGILLCLIMTWTTIISRRAIKDALAKTGADSQSVRASMDDMDGYTRKLTPLASEPLQLELTDYRNGEVVISPRAGPASDWRSGNSGPTVRSSDGGQGTARA